MPSPLPTPCASPHRALLTGPTRPRSSLARSLARRCVGAVRTGNYVPASGRWEAEPDGIDLVDDPAIIQRHFPYITDKAVCLQHVRKAGFLHVERLCTMRTGCPSACAYSV